MPILKKAEVRNTEEFPEVEVVEKGTENGTGR